ncbi:MAG: cysteine desulfurase [Gammaproteobacteria bacterium]|nr:cysteine desulfurase [Gammaproteobacteria bacterium]
MSFNVDKIRADFPILQQQVNGKLLVYLDNAATTQKPKVVLDALINYYQTTNSNVHRGVHTLSMQATDAYEAARTTCQKFINATEAREIIFCRGTTEAINLVAQAYGRNTLKTGDEILISQLEHHSNIVPWQLVCEQTGAILKVAPINEQGEIMMSEYQTLLSSKTKIVAINHVSNSLGTINPVKEMTMMAHAVGAKVLIDGAQALAHVNVDVQDINCDFYAASGHKVYAPMGIGFLYGKAAILEAMQPYQAGGEMIQTVSFLKSTYAPIPQKFEAGTPNVGDAIALGAALTYLTKIGRENIHHYEHELLDYATQQADNFPGLRIIGTAKDKISILAFVLDGIHPHDVGTILDHEGIAVRTGHHCTMPLMEFFKVPATVRASMAFYNTKQEIDELFCALRKVQEMFE